MTVNKSRHSFFRGYPFLYISVRVFFVTAGNPAPGNKPVPEEKFKFRVWTLMTIVQSWEEIVWLMIYVKCHFIGIAKRKTG